MGKEMLETLDLMEKVYPKGGTNLLGFVKNDIVKLHMMFHRPQICILSFSFHYILFAYNKISLQKRVVR